MTVVVTSTPLALRVPEAFTWVDRGLQRASDWVEYTVHAGLYPIRFHTVDWTEIPGNTRDEARALADARVDAFTYRVDRTAFWPYYAVARLSATRTRSYYENQVFARTWGDVEQHDDPATVRWTPYAYEIRPDAGAYGEWVGEGTGRRLVHRATVVEHHGCSECGAAPGQDCRQANCQGSWV